MADEVTPAGPVGSPVECAVGRLAPERTTRHLLTPDMIAAEDAAGGVFAAGDLATERTVASIPDDELLRRVVRSVAKNRPRRKEFAWSAVSEAFALGSTYSMQLCRRFGLDPDTGADLKTPNVGGEARAEAQP